MTLRGPLPEGARNASIAGVLSLIVPGSGQFYLDKRGRAVAILALVLLLAFLITWALDNFEIGQVVIGGTTTSGLWLALALFWGWNVLDAYRLARGLMSYRWLGFLLPAA